MGGTDTPIVIKKSPVVIIKNLIILEFAATIVYFGAALLANYGEIYGGFTFSETLSYEIAKFLLIATGELILIAFIFLRWFFAVYTIYPAMLGHEWGIIFKRKRIIPLDGKLSASCHYEPLSKVFKYGTLLIRSEKIEKPLAVTHVPNPELYAKLITEQNSRIAPRDEREEITDIEELLRRREHEKLEFKATFRWDTREKHINKALEKTVMKTISAFLNSDGGRLAIGVGDKGEIIGLGADYATLKRPDSDGFEIHFTNVFNDIIGPEFRQFVRLSFHAPNGKEICLLEVRPAHKPAYARFQDEENFYIRTGNSTTALPLSEVAPYIRSRWRES